MVFILVLTVFMYSTRGWPNQNHLTLNVTTRCGRTMNSLLLTSAIHDSKNASSK